MKNIIFDVTILAIAEILFFNQKTIYFDTFSAMEGEQISGEL